MKRINYLLGVLSLLIWLYFFSSYGVHNEIFAGDSLGYYSYLPSTFIYNNLTHMETSGNDRVIPDRIKDYVLQEEIGRGAYSIVYKCISLRDSNYLGPKEGFRK